MINLLVKFFIKDSENINDSSVRQRYGVFSGVTGITLNIILFAIKLIAGIISKSVSIMADAYNNLSDAGSSIITLIGFKLAGKPADKDHPFGHGRIEYISGLIVSFAIILMGFELAKTSIEKIIHPNELSFSILPIIILLISILVKCWMYFFNKTLGKKIKSEAMIATSYDSLSDTVATTTVLLGIIISFFFKINLDGILGLIVALFILFTGIKSVNETISPLLGQAPDDEFVHKIVSTVMQDKHIIGVHDLIIHNYGPGRIMMSMHAEVPSDANILEIHDIIDDMENKLNKMFSCVAVIHMDPIVVNDEKTDKMRDAIKTILLNINPRLSMHDFRMTDGHTHTNLIFDIVVPYSINTSDNELLEKINAEITKYDNNLRAVINVDRNYA